MSDGKVVVLMAAYNVAEFINEAIESVLRQSYGHFELHIFDDGSRDDTLSLAAAYTDPRVQIHHWPGHANKGKASCLNYLMEHTQCDYYMMMDADDTAHPRRIELNIQAAQADPERVLVMSGHELIVGAQRMAPNGHFYAASEVKQIFKNCRMPAHDPTMFFRADIGRELGFDEEQRLGQGVDFCQRLSERGAVHVLPDVLYHYRINPGSITHRQSSAKTEFVYRVVAKAAERRGHPIPTREQFENDNRRWLNDDNNLAGHFLESVRYQMATGQVAGAWRTVVQSLQLMPCRRRSTYKASAGFLIGLVTAGWWHGRANANRGAAS
ncbi:glycosyltransferase family 2 protein [Litorivicinus lipolyticus]|nr:glycosyltransferase family A protein [Litorivicinus lipolyticus]